MGQFNECLFPEFPGKNTAPDEAIPNDFASAVAEFLREQTKLNELDGQFVKAFVNIETTLGSDYLGVD
jgi:hypothetical protein